MVRAGASVPELMTGSFGFAVVGQYGKLRRAVRFFAGEDGEFGNGDLRGGHGDFGDAKERLWRSVPTAPLLSSIVTLESSAFSTKVQPAASRR